MSEPYWEPLAAVPHGIVPPATGQDGKWIKAAGGAAVWSPIAISDVTGLQAALDYGYPDAAWAAPTLAAAWSNVGAGFVTARYMRRGGVVFTQGVVKRTGQPSNGDLLFTLPVGFRPSMAIILDFAAVAGMARCNLGLVAAGQLTYDSALVGSPDPTNYLAFNFSFPVDG